MSKRAHGRGAIAALGLVVLCAGLIGGVVLWIVSTREPDKTADNFARAAPGCTTTVTFSEAGEYYVFEELSGVAETVEGCEATTTPGQEFAFDVRPTGGEPIERVTDTSVSYDLDAGRGTSVARITIGAPGDYAVSVLGSDPAVNAAIGDDPDEGVDQLRQAAIGAAAVGLLVGGLLLWFAGRRSRRAATFAGPSDPGWGVTERDRERRAAMAESGWASDVPERPQVPVNPHQPDERRAASPDDPADASTWAPPVVVPIAQPVVAGDEPPVPPSAAVTPPDAPEPPSAAVTPPDAPEPPSAGVTPPDAPEPPSAAVTPPDAPEPPSAAVTPPDAPEPDSPEVDTDQPVAEPDPNGSVGDVGGGASDPTGSVGDAAAVVSDPTGSVGDVGGGASDPTGSVGDAADELDERESDPGDGAELASMDDDASEQDAGRDVSHVGEAEQDGTDD